MKFQSYLCVAGFTQLRLYCQLLQAGTLKLHFSSMQDAAKIRNLQNPASARVHEFRVVVTFYPCDTERQQDVAKT